MKYLVLTCLLALAGCGTKAPQFNYSLDQDKVKAPAVVKERCEPIEKKMVRRDGEVDSVPMGELVQQTDYLIGLYGECAARDAAKADWMESQGY